MAKKCISCHHEPGGLHFTACIDPIEWDVRKKEIKRIASGVLGYKVEEPELGEGDYDLLNRI